MECKKGYYEKNGICMSKRNKKLSIGSVLFGILSILAGILAIQQYRDGNIQTTDFGIAIFWIIAVCAIVIGIWAIVELFLKQPDYSLDED